MKRWIAVVIGVAVAVGLALWFTRRHTERTEVVLYGNVDLRQVDLAFNNSERITAVYAREGDRVGRGQILARLDESRLLPQLEQAQAVAAAQRAVVDRMHHGSRPEEIAQARANVSLAQADARSATVKYERLLGLSKASSGRAVSRQDIDDAQAAADMAEARLNVNRKSLALEVAGPRREDVAQAEAQFRGEQAQVALLCRMVADTELRAPLNAVVRSRIAEPGDMASPQKTVFTLAITDPKWVRAYVSGQDLGLVRNAMRGSIAVDSFPHRRFDGWVGFVSSVAEFTPKTVETQELRSSLVYEVRFFVHDPGDVLRLGMPATVYLPITAGPPGATGENTEGGGAPISGEPGATQPEIGSEEGRATHPANLLPEVAAGCSPGELSAGPTS
ncbi:MAG TPA: efflux RND transporter periplasmic adaptor subunit [Steroidobacteraceae bacterium]